MPISQVVDIQLIDRQQGTVAGLHASTYDSRGHVCQHLARAGAILDVTA
ncbi:MAG TPA: hypothetical protein VGA56_23870 [Opitutaceae bacterium]